MCVCVCVCVLGEGECIRCVCVLGVGEFSADILSVHCQCLLKLLVDGLHLVFIPVR